MRSKRLTFAVLAVVMLFGLVLRLHNLDFGMELPYLAHTDEPTQYNPAVHIIKTGDLNPHFFRYPSLPIYLYTAVLYAGYAVGRLLGAFSSLADVRPIRILQMSVALVGTPQLLLLGRATSAALGTLTIGFVFLLARQLTRRTARQQWTPILSALLLAVSRAHVRLSHYMAVDVMATFFAVACVTACTLALAKRRTGLLWVAALCGGLATSCKYNYALLAIPVALACWLDPAARWAGKIRRTLAGGLLFGLAFALTSPYVLLDARVAWEDIRAELRHYAEGHLGITGSSAVWYVGYLWNVNPFYLLLGVPGLALAVQRGKRAAVPLVAFTVLYFWLIGRQAVHFDRNVLPVMVLLIVAAGVAVDALLSWLLRASSERAPAPVPGASPAPTWRRAISSFMANRAHRNSLATAGLLLIPLLPSLWMLPDLLYPPRPSGKALAQAWFDRALETPEGRRYLSALGSRPLRIMAEAYTVYLDPDEVDVHYVDTVTWVEREAGGTIAGPADLVALGYDVVLLGSGMYQRFYESPDIYAAQVAVYDAFFEGVPDALAFEQDDDRLAFRGQGMRVQALFLTDRARQFLAEEGLP
jgi:hypothetical protein